MSRTDKEFELHLFSAVIDLTVALSAVIHAEGREGRQVAEDRAREALRRWGGEGAAEIKWGASGLGEHPDTRRGKA